MHHVLVVVRRNWVFRLGETFIVPIFRLGLTVGFYRVFVAVRRNWVFRLGKTFILPIFRLGQAISVLCNIPRDRKVDFCCARLGPPLTVEWGQPLSTMPLSATPNVFTATCLRTLALNYRAPRFRRGQT